MKSGDWLQWTVNENSICLPSEPYGLYFHSLSILSYQFCTIWLDVSREYGGAHFRNIITLSIITVELIPLAAIRVHPIILPVPCFTHYVLSFRKWTVSFLLPSFWHGFILIHSESDSRTWETFSCCHSCLHFVFLNVVCALLWALWIHIHKGVFGWWVFSVS